MRHRRRFLALAVSLAGLVAWGVSRTGFARGDDEAGRPEKAQDIRAEWRADRGATAWTTAVEPKPLSPKVIRGLDWLVEHQLPGGGWGEGEESAEMRGPDRAAFRDNPNVADTCIASLALIRSGSTPREGPYRVAIRGGVGYVRGQVEQSDAESLSVTNVNGTRVQMKLGPNIDTYLATMLLSEVKGRMPDEASDREVDLALRKVIGKIERHQAQNGPAEGQGWAPVLAQAMCAKGINRAPGRGDRPRDHPRPGGGRGAGGLQGRRLADGAGRRGVGPAGRGRLRAEAWQGLEAADVPGYLPLGFRRIERGGSRGRGQGRCRPSQRAGRRRPGDPETRGAGRGRGRPPEYAGLRGPGAAIARGRGRGQAEQEDDPAGPAGRVGGDGEDDDRRGRGGRALRLGRLPRRPARLGQHQQGGGPAPPRDAGPRQDPKERDEADRKLARIAEAEKVQQQARSAVVERLSDPGFIAGFGSNGGEEFLSYMNLAESLVVNGGDAWKRWDGG